MVKNTESMKLISVTFRIVTATDRTLRAIKTAELDFGLCLATFIARISCAELFVFIFFVYGNPQRVLCICVDVDGGVTKLD